MPQSRISLEDAAKCPKCGKAGKLDSAFLITEGTLAGGHTNVYICDNNLCIWGIELSGWAVSTDKRGAVYQQDSGDRGHEKAFPTMSQDMISMGQRFAEDAAGKDMRNEH